MAGLTEVNSKAVLKAAALKGSPIIRGGLSANKTHIMTALTSVKYITQHELLDVLPRTMYRGMANGAQGYSWDIRSQWAGPF